MKVFRIFTLTTLTLLAALALPNFLHAQSLITGDITGTVSDPSGAVVPNATVTLTNNDNGQSKTQTTGATGNYRFALLPPGRYTVSAAAPGFQASKQPAVVAVGRATLVNLSMGLSATTQTVEVTSQVPVVQTENGNVSTTFSSEQISLTPNPGNDLSAVAQNAPGATMNTQAGYGNFSTYGLPATSNLFTFNGMNENDPFLNLNNSGATNLLLGTNDVQEATVVNNGYTGQYGQLAGAQVNYVSKAGTNNFHGNLLYWWNGRKLNANNYFNNQNLVPRPFVNANQYGGSFGGPIKKDKTFFFVDLEGLNVKLPTSSQVRVPSPGFQAATLANIGATSPAQLPFYQQIFNLYNSAAGAGAAADTLPNGGCGSFTLLGGAPCALTFQSTAGNYTKEILFSARIDQTIGANDRAFIHFRTDHGTQATFTDPINPAFNLVSTQPQYEGQLNETHTFGANSVNSFILSGSWYSALFAPPNLNAATSLLPFRISFTGGSFTTLARQFPVVPQGRNSTQYGIVDDFSVTKGRHNIKLGVQFSRNDITDFDVQSGSLGFAQSISLANFFAGTVPVYSQGFVQRPSEPLALYGLGFYVQDEWRISDRLKVTPAIRVDRYSNITCRTNCFARLSAPFESLIHDPSIPYNQAIISGQSQALPDFQGAQVEPRIGFAFQPLGGNSDLVFRGGFGLFTDRFPATVADAFLTNPPVTTSFVVGPGTLAPNAAGSVSSQAAGSSAALLSALATGGTLASISAANPFFAPPSIASPAGRLKYPRFQEWNLQMEKGLGSKMSFSLNYVGNHGIHEPYQNEGLNAFDPAGFGGLPLAAPDPRFGVINEARTDAVSNYNGVTASLSRRFSSLQLQANYTWSHALDEISNGGFLPFNFNTASSVLNPQDPFNLRAFNYGNADYDVRHYFSLNYVYNLPFKKSGVLGFLNDWTISGTLYTRTGLPFTAIDSTEFGVLSGQNYGNTSAAAPSVFANQMAGGTFNCDPGSGVNVGSAPCFNTSAFAPTTTAFGSQRRNQLFGPHYFNTDMAVMKNFHIPHWESAKFSVGAQFFNILNHPNFDQPIQDVTDPQFGTVISTVGTPTSILGSFLGGDSSPRLIQLHATLNF